MKKVLRTFTKNCNFHDFSQNGMQPKDDEMKWNHKKRAKDRFLLFCETVLNHERELLSEVRKNSIFENIFVCKFEKSWSLLKFLAFLALISPINRLSTHHKNQLVRIWHRKVLITTHPSRIQHLTQTRMELMEKFIQMVSIQLIIIITKWF